MFEFNGFRCGFHSEIAVRKVNILDRCRGRTDDLHSGDTVSVYSVKIQPSDRLDFCVLTVKEIDEHGISDSVHDDIGEAKIFNQRFFFAIVGLNEILVGDFEKHPDCGVRHDKARERTVAYNPVVYECNPYACRRP